MVKYNSTRGDVKAVSFIDAVMMGLATDGGLLVPEVFPKITPAELDAWKDLSFKELAFKVMSLFIEETEISADELKQIISDSYKIDANNSGIGFRDELITPVKQVGDEYYLELFHGPTFAFKDVALQFLGNLFGYILSKREGEDKKMTVLGATSGDTGSAAIYGLRGKPGIECFMLFPEGGVSPVQENQMCSIMDKNVHCIAVDKEFDVAQTIVKECFNDKEFRARHRLGAVNSINWARILAQIIYYFSAYYQVRKLSGDSSSPVNFSVPTGNFGDILAGYYAKKIGLPIGKLIVATNENDILDRFFKTGKYHKESVCPTLSPSMDIGISSNFERFLFDICGENSSQLSEWMVGFKSTEKLTIEGEILTKAQSEMGSFRANTDEVLEVMKSTYEKEKYLLCPHSACAVVATRNLALEGITVSLLTASPSKFPVAVKKAINIEYVDSIETSILRSLEEMEKRKLIRKATVESIQAEMNAQQSIREEGECKCMTVKKVLSLFKNNIGVVGLVGAMLGVGFALNRYYLRK